jgi:putative ABC transport system permease protein
VLRDLTGFWRLHLAVLLGAAVTATVLTGSLLVGDSMRESLRRLWLERLGDVELAMVAPRFFHATLADELERRLAHAGTGAAGGAGGRRPAAAAGGADRVTDAGIGMAGGAEAPGAAVAADRGCRAAPAIVLAGTAVHAASHRRAARIAILGVDERFAALYPGAPSPLPAGAAAAGAPGATAAASATAVAGAPGTAGSTAGAGAAGAAGGGLALALNQTLARQLGAAPGDDVLLSWEQPSAIPRSLLLAAKDPAAQLATHRATVARVVPDRGPGSFDLAPGQATSPNAFVPLAELQHELGQDGRANALLAAGLGGGSRDAAGVAAAAGRALAAALRPEDLGLALRPSDAAGEAASLVVESGEFFLSPAVLAAARAAAAELGAAAQPVSTYLAISIGARGRAIPYAMVSALGPPLGPGELLTTAGAPAAVPAGDEILLDSWAAGELAARPGDRVELSYFLPDSGNAAAPLRAASASFRMSGVVALAGLGADRGLTPPLPGIDQARDMASWSPPFPVDLSRVRPRDEEFWRRYGPTPKAFVSLAAARRLWHTGFGDATALRVALPPAAAARQAFAARFERRLLERLDPAAFGLALRPVRAAGLRAASEGTDFSSLFVSFSSFLIVASALLTGLLFALGLERRAREIGLLLALGYRTAALRRRFLGQGLVLAGAGALVGAAGAAGYAALLLGRLVPAIAGWQPAAGMPRLALAVSPSTLAWGWLAAVGTVLVFLAAGVRRLSRLPAARLLAGVAAAGRGGGGRGWRLVLGLSAAAAAALGGALLAARGSAAPALAFGAGASVLAAGICGFALWCLGTGRGEAALRGLPAMGLRNTAAHPGRSVLSVALVACACFVLVLVAANRRGGEEARREWSGFSLVAAAATPIYQDLGRPEGRRALGFSEAAERLLAGGEIVGLPAVPGDDASCLNLFRPQRPRLLGVPPELARRRLPPGTVAAGSLAELFARAGAAGRPGRASPAGRADSSSPADSAGPGPANPAGPANAAGRLGGTGPARLAGPAGRRGLAGPVPAGRPGPAGSAGPTGPASPTSLADPTAELPAVGDEQTVRWILHLGVGETLTLTDEGGAPLGLRIAGLLAGSPLQGALLVPEADLARRFPHHGGRAFFLIRPPAGREAAVAALLGDQLRDFGFEVVPVAERLRLYARVEDTYLASFQALGSLGLLLGTCGLAVVLLRNAVERRWELAALRAFGFRRRRLAGLLLLENAALLVLGVALGTAAGLLPEALGAGATGGMGGLPWRPLAATLGAVLAAGLAASVAAAAGALAAPLVPVLKAEP